MGYVLRSFIFRVDGVLKILTLEYRKFPICVTVIASSSPAEGGMGDLLALCIENCDVHHTGYATHRDVVLGIGITLLEA